MINIERAHELKEILLAKYTNYLEAEIKFVVENEYAEAVDARGLALLKREYDLAEKKYYNHITPPRRPSMLN